MKPLLQRLERWLEQHYPGLLADLNPGADDEALEALEENLQVRLPDAYKTLLRWHDGQVGDAAGLFGNWFFLPSEEVIQEHENWKTLVDKGLLEDKEGEARPEGPVRPIWWHQRWVPFTSDGDGNNHCLDMAPADNGHQGQIITVWHEHGARPFVASSLEAWLEEILQQLASGGYQLLRDDEGLEYFEPEGFVLPSYSDTAE
jgi:cell wall assembly regulator SMI1